MTIETDRLLRLADMLEGIDPKRFNLWSWKTVERGCGTVACAVGYACMDKKFMDMGLRHESIPIYRPSISSTKTLYGWDAVVGFFGLTLEQSYFLFQDPRRLEEDIDFAKSAYCDSKPKSDFVVTPSMVSTAIRKFLSENSPAEKVIIIE